MFYKKIHINLYTNLTVIKMVKMPQEGQDSVTIPTYVWEKAQTYFKKHKTELRKKGIKSTTKLISVWIEEKCAQE